MKPKLIVTLLIVLMLSTLIGASLIRADYLPEETPTHTPFTVPTSVDGGAQRDDQQSTTFVSNSLPSIHPAPIYPDDITPDPIIQMMMSQVTSSTVRLYDGDLSGEWPVQIDGTPYTIVTRNTNSGAPIQHATQFIGEHFANLGLAVEYHQWGGSTYPNVIGQIDGISHPEEIYIISAHLDDMPSGGVAPGADDNASGVVATLIAADILSQYQWDCTIRFGVWTGEEQGLNGSEAYAMRSFNNGENIAGVLNLDMIAWNTPDSSRDIDLHANSSIPSTLTLAQLMADVISTYNINLIPEIVPNGSSASDHASFWQYGYTAILGIEDFSDFNPYYHTTNDLLANVDLDYFTDFVRAGVGTFAHMSGCLIPGGIGYLGGNVRDASSNPIANASITAQNGDGTIFNTISDGSGYYTRTLLADTYTVTAVAYGYLPQVVTGITIITDTVTLQDFTLMPAPTYNISGTITELGTGLPLSATVRFTESPIAVNSDPVTGYYSATLPAGSYTIRVTALDHRQASRSVVVDQDQTQNFALEPLPCILLVDDDNNNPDVRPYYTDALDALGYEYDIYDVSGGGPSLSELQGYQIVIWFSGDKFGGEGAGPNANDETALAAYLNGGGHLFLSSQDYLYDMTLTSFGQTYLGIASYTSDSGNASTKYGLVGDPIGGGMGPYTLSYPSGFSDYGDIVNPGSGGSTAFRSAASGGNNLDVDKSGANWKTVFFGTSWVPIAYADANAARTLLDHIIDWFGGCACQPVQILAVATTTNACVVDFDPDYSGDAPFTWDWTFQGSIPTASQDENPNHIDFGISGTHAYTLTMNNCGGLYQDTFHDTVQVSCDSCIPITSVLVTQVTTSTIQAGDTVTFSAAISPETAVSPFTYTVRINDTAVLTNQIGSDNPLFFAYPFGQSGTYTVTLEIWNCSLITPIQTTIPVVVQLLQDHTLYLPLIQNQVMPILLSKSQ